MYISPCSQVFCRGAVLVIEADGVARAELIGAKQSAGHSPCPHCTVTTKDLSNSRFNAFENKRSTASIAAAQERLRDASLNKAQITRLSKEVGVVVPGAESNPLYQLHLDLVMQVPIDGFHQQAEVC